MTLSIMKYLLNENIILITDIMIYDFIKKKTNYGMWQKYGVEKV